MYFLCNGFDHFSILKNSFGYGPTSSSQDTLSMRFASLKFAFIFVARFAPKVESSSMEHVVLETSVIVVSVWLFELSSSFSLSLKIVPSIFASITRNINTFSMKQIICKFSFISKNERKQLEQNWTQTLTCLHCQKYRLLFHLEVHS